MNFDIYKETPASGIDPPYAAIQSLTYSEKVNSYEPLWAGIYNLRFYTVVSVGTGEISLSGT
jgi:hypothetical protein